ncbi:unnamed protein product [Alternaria alternata]|uniref:uncharacterized protein n=1 Tax=Alternaria postmessia TaxID=1187938 RepID=UPI002224DCCD|nr:uncharacterized protein J4E82_011017 [Alternaria postmessia]KAI5366870.1 hypothetical protein J4E82_011017 [Alternaria postmessia]
MANLPRPFLIELDGQFVANPRMSGEMDEYTKIPASIGDRANAAIFELRDGYLRRLGGPEPLHFGRFFVEPPLYGPLPLYWIANRNQVRPSQYIGDEDSPQTFEMAVYVLKKDRLALLDDITNILKNERLMLSSRCIDRLGDCLMAKLEPTLIPHDRNDPDRAINMAQSARLRNIKAQGPYRIVKRTKTSKHTSELHQNSKVVRHVRLGRFAGSSDVHESRMDGEFIPLDGATNNEDADEYKALAITEAGQHNVGSRNFSRFA